MEDSQQPNMPLRPEDFEDIQQELKREGKSEGLVIKSLKVFTYPAKRLQRRYHTRYRWNPKHLVLDIAILVTVLLLIGANVFYWLGGFHYFSNNLDLSVKMSSSETVIGETTTFFIDYQNNNNFPVDLSNLTVTLPEHFQISSVSKTEYNRQNNTLYVGSLEPGANGSVAIQGIVLGELDQMQEMDIQFNYFKTNKWGARMWGQFYSAASTRFAPTDSLIDIQMATPDHIVVGQPTKIALQVTNHLPFTAQEIKIVPRFGNFTTITDEAQALEQGIWYAYDLATDESMRFDPEIIFAADALSQEMAVDVYLKYDGDYLLQRVFVERLPLIDPRVDLTWDHQGTSIRAGESLNAVITIANENDFAIEDLVIHVQMSEPLWALDKIEPTPTRVDGFLASWTHETVPELLSLEQHTSEKYAVSLPMKADAPLGSYESAHLRALVSFTYEGQSISLRSFPIELPFDQSVNTIASLRYFSNQGEQLGRGPLPPEVGEQTVYWVFLQIDTSEELVSGGALTMILPDGVAWLNQTSVIPGTDLIFNAPGKTVTWSVDKIQKSDQPISAAFAVGFTPNASHKGADATIIKNIQFDGTTDSGPLSYGLPALTTDLISDEKGHLKSGKVQ